MQKKDLWDLEHDKTGRVVHSWPTKAEATKGGVLEKAIGGEGSVKIQKKIAGSKRNGRFLASAAMYSCGPRSVLTVCLNLQDSDRFPQFYLFTSVSIFNDL